MELRLFQRDIAAIFKVSTDCIIYWENNRSEPQIRYYPPIFEFLGYYPFEFNTATFAGKIKYYRYLNGLTQKQFAKLMNVDPATVSRWEDGKVVGAKKNEIDTILSSCIVVVDQYKAKGLNSD